MSGAVCLAPAMSAKRGRPRKPENTYRVERRPDGHHVLCSSRFKVTEETHLIYPYGPSGKVEAELVAKMLNESERTLLNGGQPRLGYQELKEAMRLYLQGRRP